MSKHPYPFRIVADPTALNLTERFINTPFGRQHVIARNGHSYDAAGIHH